MTVVSYDRVPVADLLIDCQYEGGPGLSDDPVFRIFNGRCNNIGGFRDGNHPSEQRKLFVALVSTESVPDWPDGLDADTGVFTYYGDNRVPGDLHKNKRGNLTLKKVFAQLDAPCDRRQVPPFFVFTKGDGPRGVRFRGLAVPGAPGHAPSEQLVAVWKSRAGIRFQNYRALFSILNVNSVPRAWIEDVLSGNVLTENAPPEWERWVDSGHAQALVSSRAITHRSKSEQLPTPGTLQADILEEIYSRFPKKADAHRFETVAAALWRMSDPNVTSIDLTRPWRDGGRDALGLYRLGACADPVDVEFALEAKCHRPDIGSGVKDVSRLIARLLHRQFGVFVTTSYVSQQAYKEIKDDGHPVVIMTGLDIARLLIDRGFTSRAQVRAWLDAVLLEP